MIKEFTIHKLYNFIDNLSCYPGIWGSHSNSDSGFAYMLNFINDAFAIVKSIWNYKLFTAENQPVAISNLVIAIIFLFAGLKLAKYCSNLIYNKLLRIISLDISVTDLLGKILHYLFIIIVTIIVLDIAHLPLTVFTFIGGALTISLGVGSQHVINNFISGLVLMVQNPIKVGDFVEIEETRGRVVSIDARSVNIRTDENKNVIIPHSMILQNKVTNWTATDNKIRTLTKIEVNHGAISAYELKKILLEIVASNQDILVSPKPQVLLCEFDRNIMVFEVNFWVNLALVSRVEVISDLNFLISEAFNKNEISFAVDYRKPIA